MTERDEPARPVGPDEPGTGDTDKAGTDPTADRPASKRPWTRPADSDGIEPGGTNS